MNKKVCLVTGVGPGTGTAIVKRFASNYDVAMLARSADRLNELSGKVPSTFPFPTDVRSLDALEDSWRQIIGTLGPPDIVVHNAVRGEFGLFSTISTESLEKNFRVNVSALLRLAQLVAPHMIEYGEGAIIATGNTAAYRGVPNFASFAPTKAAQRILLESLARTLGPQGVHVAYIAIDAVIDLPWTRANNPDKPDDYYCKPSDIADHVWHVAHQPKSAWTFDSTIRPFGERW